MENISWTIVSGILIVFIWKGVFSVLKYVRMCRKLRKVPQQHSHWLLGHLNRLKSSKDYVKYGMEMYKTGCKLFCVWLGPYPVLCVTHPDTFKQLIGQDHRKARGRLDGYNFLEDWMGEGLLISDCRKWERSRNLLTPAFHFSILTGYVDIMNSVSDDFQEKVIENMSASTSVDIYPLVSRTTLDAMMKCSLSFDGSMQAKETPYIPHWLYYLTSEGREWKKLINVMHGFTMNIIDAREHPLEVGQSDGKRRLDFLDILLTAKDEQGRGLDRQEIQDEVDTFTFEGHDTTASALAWGIYALGQYPDIQEKVYEDAKSVLGSKKHVYPGDLHAFKYIPMYIKEILRYYSPVPLIGRKSPNTLVLDGLEIPPGSRVDVHIYVMHHNPAIWKNPEEFRPERFSDKQR